MASLNCPLRDQALTNADGQAMLTYDQIWTFAELDSLAGSLARKLEHKFKPGDVLLAVANNSPLLIALLLPACARG